MNKREIYHFKKLFAAVLNAQRVNPFGVKKIIKYFMQKITLKA